MQCALSNTHRDLDFASERAADGACVHASTWHTPKAFSYTWSGARGTIGLTGGRYAFEVRVAENLDVGSALPPASRHLVRVGFSLDDVPTNQLGEHARSWAFGGSGKKSCGGVFEDYGEAFGVGDVVHAMVDRDTHTVSFAKNGEWLGIAFALGEELHGQALFPHVLLKNTRVDINFGQDIWFSPQPLYSFVDLATPIHTQALLDTPPVRKEMVMLIGLSGSGKTTWANKHREDNPDMQYHVIGTNQLVEQMKVPGVGRSGRYNARWQELIRLASAGFDRHVTECPAKPQNFILDQVNFSKHARQRKLAGFRAAGFRVVGVVLMCSEFQLQERVAKQRREGRSIPTHVQANMALQFELPEDAEFDELVWVDGTRQTAQANLAAVQRSMREQLAAEGDDNAHHGDDNAHHGDANDNPRKRAQGGQGAGDGGPRPRKRARGHNSNRR